MFRRPIFGKLLAIAELLFFVLCSALTAYCLYLTRSPEILREKESAEIVRGLLIGAGVVFGTGAVFGVSGFALLLHKKWGWWLGLAASIVVTAACVVNRIKENSADLDEWILTGAFIVAIIWFLLPGVRNYLVAPEAATVVGSPETATNG